MKFHSTRNSFHHVMIVTAVSLLLGTVGLPVLATTAADLDADVAHALNTLYSTPPEAKGLANNSLAVLVFPKNIKAGLSFGGSYGEGVITRGGKFYAYCNSVSTAWGWQAGAESYGYVVFLMNDKVVKFLDKNNGWEVGAVPSLVLLDEGGRKSIAASSVRDETYANVFDQQGLMASLCIEGAKITEIKKV